MREFNRECGEKSTVNAVKNHVFLLQEKQV
jgi:hypothetical protein